METIDNWSMDGLFHAQQEHRRITDIQLVCVDRKRDAEIELKKVTAEIEKGKLLLETVKQEIMNIKLRIGTLPR